MKALKRIGFVVLGILILLLVIAYIIPAEIEEERSIVIDAPPEVVFENVNSLQRWEAWSPWADLDPNMKSSFEGPAEGVGNTNHWESDDPAVGAGTQRITQSEHPKRIETHLDFGEMGEATATWRFDAQGDGSTAVTWGFATDMGSNPIGRYYGLVLRPSIRDDYDKGLAQLKELSEQQAAEAAMFETDGAEDTTP